MGPGPASPVPETPSPGAMKIVSIFDFNAWQESLFPQSKEGGPSPAPQPSSEEPASEASEAMHRRSKAKVPTTSRLDVQRSGFRSEFEVTRVLKPDSSTFHVPISGTH